MSDDKLSWWAPGETPGCELVLPEAFIPRRGNRERSKAILEQAARWYDPPVEPPVRSHT